MTKIKELLKKSSRFFLGLAIGLTLSIGVGYAVTVAGSSTTYDKSTSGLSSTNVQAAIDELYKKAKDTKVNTNIVNAYTYDKINCTTGEELGCTKSNCLKNKSRGSCPAGTIIDYKVNNTTQVRFHVIQDDGTTMTLQSQMNTLRSVPWNETGYSVDGPVTALSKLEEATASWTNVNTFDYSIGNSSSTLGYSGRQSDCRSTYQGGSICSDKFETPYQLSKKGVRARMITYQEAKKVGCSWGYSNTCPIWITNFVGSKDPGKTSYSGCESYWSMTAWSYCEWCASGVTTGGKFEHSNSSCLDPYENDHGATFIGPTDLNAVRAVVVINK